MRCWLFVVLVECLTSVCVFDCWSVSLVFAVYVVVVVAVVVVVVCVCVFDVGCWWLLS